MQAGLLIRGEGDRLRSSMSFSISGCLHGGMIAWLALYSAGASWRPEPAKSAYDLEIRPNEEHLVWYNLRDKLPDVSSGKPRKDNRPLRAKVKFRQNVVAGVKDLPAPPQLIRMPAPQIVLPKELALPNVLAVAPPPRPVKPFQPPPIKPGPETKPSPAELPSAPRLAIAQPDRALPFDAASPKPKPREFAAPPPVQRAAVQPADLAAPEVRVAAPEMVAPKIPRGFTAPVPKAAAAVRTEQAIDAPAIELAAPVASPAALAVVGLNPVKAPDAPLPTGSHEAAFSAGPELHAKGSSEPPADKAAVTLPGLVSRGGGKDNPGSVLSVLGPVSHQPVIAAERSAPAEPSPPPPAGVPHAAHVTSAPDARMKGRYVYTVAIQMPNVTSYSGSWIVWFADRDPVTGSVPADMRPPVAVHKVDPKYIVTAVEERVQGIVRLAAVIRRDGHVQEVELLQHLDERLDRSAKEALIKWVFEPAQRNGVPVEVDAVFEIPFRLAPKPSR
jgi:TonB family protein